MEALTASRKPFHESVVELIEKSSSNDLQLMGILLTRTYIPSGHDEIIAAWTKRCAEMCWPRTNAQQIADNVRRHKESVEACNARTAAEFMTS
jgi:hypothetical protein